MGCRVTVELRDTSANTKGATMAYEFVTYEVRDHVAHVVMNRPDALNALHPGMSAEMAEAWIRFDADDDAWVGILSGAGRAFCAGLDMRALAQASAEGAEPSRGGAGGIVDPESRPVKPVIAAVQGYAFGAGLEMTLACDLAVAAEGAEFGLLEARNGRVAGAAIHRLTRHIPMKHALGIIMTGRRFPAHEALAMGLVNEVVPADDLMAAAGRWADELLAAAPLSTRGGKQSAYDGLDYPSLVEATRASYPLADIARASEDGKEALRAFSERRKPEWQGR